MTDCFDQNQAPCLPDKSSPLIELNRGCFCLPIDRKEIDAGIKAHSKFSGIGDLLSARENLFAGTAVFISVADVEAIESQINAFETLALLEGYQSYVLAGLDKPTVNAQTGTRSICMGYDFHITEAGPRLIEINTNAGGAFLIASLEHALSHVAATCGGAPLALPSTSDRLLAEMFETEWHNAGRNGKPKFVAIIDQNPTEQYLHPDMILAQECLQRHGIYSVIADPNELVNRGNKLYVQEKPIDMVYNRLTDFSLAAPENNLVQQALARDLSVVSPAPRHHALYANKKNLALASNVALLEQWGLPHKHISALADIPKTRIVTPEIADILWAERKNYFFKPMSGFGSRATYRGSKLTKRVWQEIIKGDYVAQAFIPPTLRAVELENGPVTLKYDVRVFTYAGKIQLMAARVYQGQTTNFRTKGGGFAPIFKIG